MKKTIGQLGTDVNQKGYRKSGRSWVLVSSVVIASLLAVNAVAKYADLHEVARDYHHAMQDDANQRMQVLSLVTSEREK